VKRRAPLLLLTLAVASACEDFGFYAPQCEVDDDCPDGNECRSDVNTGVLTCLPEQPIDGADDGSCNGPFARTLPFSFDGTTAGLFDAYSITCAEDDVSEMLFAIEIPPDRDVHVVANDSSGQGIAVELIGGRLCGGTVRSCASQANGIIDEVMTGDTGTNLVVVERNPNGPFTLTVELAD
jgi:hypothetical protein